MSKEMHKGLSATVPNIDRSIAGLPEIPETKRVNNPYISKDKLKVLAFDFMNEQNKGDSLTVEAEHAIFDFVNYVMKDGKENVRQ